MKELGYYPANYDEARQRFLESLESLRRQGLRPESHSFRVPSLHDPGLYVDSVYIPPKENEELLLILLSGVHGPEGFVGSAIQQMFLQELLPEVPREKVGLLIVHTLNPFGFKYGRRATENNVNLNRNFAASDDLFKNSNTGYEKIAHLLEPEERVGGPSSSLIHTTLLVARCLTMLGFTGAELNQAIAGGQFEYPRGIEYGGKEREPQITHFIDLAYKTMSPYRDIVLLDLHTGLGDRYQLHIIPVPNPASTNPGLLRDLFDPKKDRGLYVYTPTDSAGFYVTHGDSNSLLPHFATNHQRVLALTFELGTLGNGTWTKIDSLSRIIAENRGFHKGYTSARAEKDSKRRFIELFYPSETRWRKNAVSKARETLTRILKRLKNRAPLPQVPSRD